MTTRIAKFISECGIASRRDAEKMIADGRVSVNGEVIDTPVFFVSTDDVVCVDGTTIQERTETSLYMFHKPVNCLTTLRDECGRKTIYDLVNCNERLFSIGRLDYDTEGLIILTNDGDLFLSYARQVLEQTSLLEEKFLNKSEQKSKFSVMTSQVFW